VESFGANAAAVAILFAGALGAPCMRTVVSETRCGILRSDVHRADLDEYCANQRRNLSVGPPMLTDDEVRAEVRERKGVRATPSLDPNLCRFRSAHRRCLRRRETRRMRTRGASG